MENQGGKERMIKIMHRLIRMTGKYKKAIRASYITSFFKGCLMKMPLMLSFLMIKLFMEGTMDKKTCLIFGIVLFASVILQAVFEHLTNILQSAAGYKVFADMRIRLGDHLRKLPMGYFTEGNIGKISSILSTDMVFIEENCMGVLSELVSFIISQALMISSLLAAVRSGDPLGMICSFRFLRILTSCQNVLHPDYIPILTPCQV